LDELAQDALVDFCDVSYEPSGLIMAENFLNLININCPRKI